MSGLEVVGESQDLIVQSKANPDARLLLLIRSIIQGNKDLDGLFFRFREEKRSVEWLRDLLAPQVAARLSEEECNFADVVDACQYLGDEYHQLGEGYFIVSQETGRVELVVSESDLYDPGLLPREGGGVGQALARLHPKIEQAFIVGRSERAREEHAVSLLAERGHQTELLRQEGDRRLLVATRKGRTRVAEELSADNPLTLLRRAGGSPGMFLRHFYLSDEYVTEGVPHIKGIATCRSTLGVQDMLTLNLGYNRLGVLRSSVPQAWLRDIARELSLHVKQLNDNVVPLRLADVGEPLLGSQELWVADPDVFVSLRRSAVVPAEGSAMIGFSGRVGSLIIAKGFGVETRERSDHWEVTATLPYKLYVDLSKIQYVPLVEVAHAGALA